MSSFDAKNSIVLDRQLEVQKLSIPLVIVGNATAASVSLRDDEPAVLFLASAAVDQITPALSVGETATYSAAAVDATGVFHLLVRIQEPVLKVVRATVVSRTDGTSKPCYLGSATGITTGTGTYSGQDIMLICTATVDFTGANTLDACLEVEYVVDETAKDATA